MEGLVKKVCSSAKIYTLLRLICHLCVAVAAVGYALLLWSVSEVSATSLLSLVLITAIPFLAVTLVRRFINAPRPYEVWGLDVPPKRRSGRSFPSRHAFSIFIIGTVALFRYPIMGGVILFLGICLAAARVLMGLHFVRDVVAGALIGAVCGIIGVLLASPF